MDHLFEKGDYSWSLFIGHLFIEKLLKALYIQKVDITPPFIHDLVRLSEKVGLSLTEDQKDIIDTISTLSLRVRYDDYKLSFHMQVELMKIRRKFDTRIEPHPFSQADFNASNALANEILRNGLLIA